MAKIYDKVTSSVDFPIDKSLILDSKDAYHIPFTFGDNWTHIRLGVLMSIVDSDDDNFASLTTSRDIGGFELPTSSTWFGVNKNLSPLKLPTESGSGGFIGYKADAYSQSNTVISSNCYGNTDENGNPWSQRFIVTSGTEEVVALNVNDGTSEVRGSFPNEGCLGGNTSGYVDSPSQYCVANVLEIKIINKGTSSEKVQIRNNVSSSSSRTTYGDIDSLKIILTEGGSFNTNIDWYEADLGDNRWADQTDYYPDSFLFYNSAPVPPPGAWPGIRPRIHCWAVQKLA